MKKRTLDTRLIHSGEPYLDGSVSLPIYQSSTFLLDGDAAYEQIRYGRMSNSPTHEAVQRKIAAAEGAEEALVFASGMAAITTTLLTFLRPGDHIIAQDTLYGGTWSFVHQDLTAAGVEVSTFPSDDPGRIRDLKRPNTRVLYTESITNPLMYVTDHREIVKTAKELDLLSVIDNTFTSPVNFRPLELGYDVAVHSATKYLNGHSDLIAGAVASRSELVERIHKKMIHTGGSLNALSAYFLYRGLKTLALRMARHNENALALATALSLDQVRRT